MNKFLSLRQKVSDFLESQQAKGPAMYAAAEQAIGAVLIADGFFGLESPFGQNRRPGIFGTFPGMVIGIIFIFVPSLVGGLSHIDAMTATAPATVVAVGSPVISGKGGSSCSAVASFNVGGQEYKSQASMSSSGMCSLAPGQSISINYDPKNPNDWAYGASSLKLFLRIFFWVGVLVLVSSIITFLIRLISIILGWKLLRKGRRDAASLPQGTDLSTIVSEIKHSFTSSLFGFGANASNPSVTANTNFSGRDIPPPTAPSA